MNGGARVPAPLQRMRADDLLAAAFPDAAACLENIPGDRQIPDHPLVNQTVRDCLEEAMDLPRLSAILSRIHDGQIQCVARDTTEPSPLSHEILNARPYAFLDDAPLEERRAHAVYARRATEPGSEFGALDAAAIDRVREEARPDPRDDDEVHDALLTAGLLAEDEVSAPAELFHTLASAGRATQVTCVARAFRPATMWIAAERLPELLAIHSDVACHPAVTPPASRAARTWTREEALTEIVRGRMTLLGPTTADAIATSLGVSIAEVDAALLALESEGVVLRGQFTGTAAAADGPMEWCDRRLLARIHRYTLNRLRAEIEAVSPADFTRFLFAWQHVDRSSRLTGIDGVRALVQVLDGYELAAGAWERAVLPARLDKYDPAMLDMLCLTGEVGWARLSSGPAAVVGATPIALFLRDHLQAWIATRGQTATSRVTATPTVAGGPVLSPDAHRVRERLETRGALFFNELRTACELPAEAAAAALGELVGAGLVTSDGFAGLRTLIAGVPAQAAGRWAVIASPEEVSSLTPRDEALEQQAWTLLRRYGVVFRRVLARETNIAPWRVLARVLRRLELRGEIRGGRFVAGMSGEQFALPDAVTRLREIRRTPPDGRLMVISAADPLNLAGIITAGERVRAVAGTRIVYCDGVPLAALEGDYIRQLAPIDASIAATVASTLAGRPVPPIVTGYIGRTG
jgi:ATP-dependent Lhr-like helicase